MKAKLKVRSNLIIEVESEKMTELMAELSHAQEVFDIPCCGACQSEDIRFVERQNENEDKFYELHCKKCFSRLVYGVHKKGGGMYPKKRWDSLSDTEKQNRADEQGKCDKFGNLPNGGWYKYKKKEG